MKQRTLTRRLAALSLVLLLIFPSAPPSWAFFGSLTIEKERQIGEEFLLELQQYYSISSDPFINSYINHLGQKLVAQLGPQPFKYHFFVLDEPSINAFAVPGGYIFVTTGIVRMMEREGELAGVLAHEISHVYARHMARQTEKAKIANIATLVGALAAVLLGVGPLAEGLMMGSMAASESAMLKYSRDMEQEADGLGFKWMMKAGYNPWDCMSVFKKLSRQRWFEGGKIPVYLSTHPETDTRLVETAHQLSMYRDKLPPPRNDPDFQFFALKVEASCGNPHQLLRRMTQESLRDPKNPAFPYGKALALARLEKIQEATAAFQQALQLAPNNVLIQRDLATFYFDKGRHQEALQILERLAQSQPRDEVVLFYLGRIYQEKHQTEQALALMEKVHVLNPAITEVYYCLGTLYGEKGNMGLAHYYLGFHSLKAKAYPTALFHFRKALVNLPAADLRSGEVRTQIARLEKMRIRVSN